MENGFQQVTVPDIAVRLIGSLQLQLAATTEQLLALQQENTALKSRLEELEVEETSGAH